MAVNRIYGAISITNNPTGLTTNPENGSLKGISKDIISDGDMAVVRDITGESIHFYTYDESSSAMDDNVKVVKPEGGSVGRWLVTSPKYFAENIIVDSDKMVLVNKIAPNGSNLVLSYNGTSIDLSIGSSNITITKPLITDKQITSTVVDGTPAFIISSSTMIPNLRAEYIGNTLHSNVWTKDASIAVTGVPVLDGTLDSITSITNARHLTTKDYVDNKISIVNSSFTKVHNNLTGLTTGDPHTQYMLVDGSRPFNNNINFPRVSTDLVNPINTYDLVHKKYVDDRITLISQGDLFVTVDGSSIVTAPILYDGAVDFSALDAQDQAFASVDYVKQSFINHNTGITHTEYLINSSNDTIDGHLSTTQAVTTASNQYITRGEIDAFLRGVYKNTYMSDYYIDIGSVVYNSNIVRKDRPRSDSNYTFSKLESSGLNLVSYEYLRSKIYNILQGSPDVIIGDVLRSTLISGSDGYLNGSDVTVRGGSGTGMVINITTDGSGTITSYNIVDSGMNYVELDTVYVNGTSGGYVVGDIVSVDSSLNGIGGELRVTEVDSYGKVIQVSVSLSGSGYQDETCTTTAIQGQGTGLTVDIVEITVDGLLSTPEVSINQSGDGDGRYKVGDTVRLVGGNNDTVITIDTVLESGEVTDFTVTNGGTGGISTGTYTTTSLSGDGLGLTFDVVDGGDGIVQQGEININVPGTVHASIRLDETVRGAYHSYLIGSGVGDDHTQYMHIDCRRGFDNSLNYPRVNNSSIEPTQPGDLITKSYFDSRAGLSQKYPHYYFTQNVDTSNDESKEKVRKDYVDRYVGLSLVSPTDKHFDYLSESFVGNGWVGALDSTYNDGSDNGIIITNNFKNYGTIVNFNLINGGSNLLSISAELDRIPLNYPRSIGDSSTSSAEGSGLSVDTTISDGYVTYVSLTYGGTSYTTNGSGVSTTSSGSGTGLLVSIESDGNSVTKVTVDSGGSGYVTDDVVSISGSGNGDATLVVQSVSDGVVTGVSINDGGVDYSVNDVLSIGNVVGYKNGDTVTVDGGTTLASITITGVTPYGDVLTFTVTDGGTGYSMGTDISTTTTSGLGIGLTFDINPIDGILSTGRVTLSNKGTLTKCLARVTSADVNGTVSSLSIIHGGSGYASLTEETTTGIGYPTMDISGINVNRTETSVVLDESGGGGTTLGIVPRIIGSIQFVSIINSGYGYQVGDTIDWSGDGSYGTWKVSGVGPEGQISKVSRLYSSVSQWSTISMRSISTTNGYGAVVKPYLVGSISDFILEGGSGYVANNFTYDPTNSTNDGFFWSGYGTAAGDTNSTSTNFTFLNQRDERLEIGHYGSGTLESNVGGSGSFTVPASSSITGVQFDTYGHITNILTGITTISESWSKQTSDFVSSFGYAYFVDTSSGAITVQLPDTVSGTILPSIGDILIIDDYKGSSSVNNIKIRAHDNDGGSNNIIIEGVSSQDLILDVDGAKLTMIYVDAVYGWRYKIS